MHVCACSGDLFQRLNSSRQQGAPPARRGACLASPTCRMLARCLPRASRPRTCARKGRAQTEARLHSCSAARLSTSCASAPPPLPPPPTPPTPLHTHLQDLWRVELALHEARQARALGGAGRQGAVCVCGRVRRVEGLAGGCVGGVGGRTRSDEMAAARAAAQAHDTHTHMQTLPPWPNSAGSSSSIYCWP